MSTLTHDLRAALRALARQPAYAAVTILVLTLAIGANTTVFSVFNAFFLRPLPYPDDDRLVLVGNRYPKMLGGEAAGGGTSVPDYLDRREQAGSLEDLAIYTREERTLTGDAAPEQLLLTRALAVIGIYAVLTWAVTQRVGEIGVRMALSAAAVDVVRMVLKQGAKLTAAGLVVGALGALVLGRLLQSQVRDVGAADPVVLGVALAGLAAASLAASWLPARRATRIDPIDALRAE